MGMISLQKGLIHLTTWKDKIGEDTLPKLEMLIVHLIQTGYAHLIPKAFQELKNKLIDDSALVKFEKRKEMMKEAIPHAKNDEIRDLLDPETFVFKKVKTNRIDFSYRREISKKKVTN